MTARSEYLLLARYMALCLGGIALVGAVALSTNLPSAPDIFPEAKDAFLYSQPGTAAGAGLIGLALFLLGLFVRFSPLSRQLMETISEPSQESRQKASVGSLEKQLRPRVPGRETTV